MGRILIINKVVAPGMRILVDLRLLSKGGTSGIEEYARNLLNNLFALDKRNEYNLFYNGFQKVSLTSNLQLPASNCKIIDWRIPNKILDFSSRFLRWPAIDKFIPTDAIFSPHFNILKTKKAPRVITFHDLSFLHHPYFFSPKQKFWHWLQDYRAQAMAAERVIAVSEFTKSDLVNLLKIPPEKIAVIYSGVSDSFRKMPVQDDRLNFPYILYLGTLEPRKNVLAIIRAFNILKSDLKFFDFKLVLAGKPGWLYRTILREVQNSPYKDDIILWGSISDHDRVSLYNLARVFVYPSFFEGFGFPPLEAQACGCPVVVADRTSLPEVVGDSALRVNPWKIDELSEAIKQAVFNDDLKREMITKGLENVKRFNWRDTAAKVLSCLENL